MACVHGGEHQLTAIYQGRDDGVVADVVRWCRFCGSVVIDRDCDNRTNAGAILPMQTPSLLTQSIELVPQYEGRQGTAYVQDVTGILGLVYRTVVGGSRELWAIERCNFPTEKAAASALAILVRAGLLPRR